MPANFFMYVKNARHGFNQRTEIVACFAVMELSYAHQNRKIIYAAHNEIPAFFQAVYSWLCIIWQKKRKMSKQILTSPQMERQKNCSLPTGNAIWNLWTSC